MPKLLKGVIVVKGLKGHDGIEGVKGRHRSEGDNLDFMYGEVRKVG